MTGPDTPADALGLSVADLTRERFMSLVEHGEHLTVELKSAISDEALGPQISSFANTLGGWLLLGVDDDKAIVGWSPKGGDRTDAQQSLSQRIANTVSPQPPVIVRALKLDGGEGEQRQVVAVRVFPSDDTPVVVRRTGGVYVRTNEGKQPIRDHATLMALAGRGHDAEARASQRIITSVIVTRWLVPPDFRAGRRTQYLWSKEPEEDSESFQRHSRVIVRAAPVTVTPQWTEWALSKRAADAAGKTLLAIYPTDKREIGAGRGLWQHVDPRARGCVGRRRIHDETTDSPFDRVSVAIDAGGVVGLSYDTGTRPEGAGSGHQVDADELRRDRIEPMLDAITSLLVAGEAIGRAKLDLTLSYGGRPYIASDLPNVSWYGGEYAVGGHADIRPQAAAWQREIERSAGSYSWEP